jgi:folylpolyglutamate synthase/dihydropteroate synthase
VALADDIYSHTILLYRLEHTRILGDTIEKIALDKSGVIKQNIPVLVGEDCPHELIQAIAAYTS